MAKGKIPSKKQEKSFIKYNSITIIFAVKKSETNSNPRQWTWRHDKQ